MQVEAGFQCHFQFIMSGGAPNNKRCTLHKTYENEGLKNVDIPKIMIRESSG